jgi:hypothetical protein
MPEVETAPMAVDVPDAGEAENVAMDIPVEQAEVFTDGIPLSNILFGPSGLPKLSKEAEQQRLVALNPPGPVTAGASWAPFFYPREKMEGMMNELQKAQFNLLDRKMHDLMMECTLANAPPTEEEALHIMVDKQRKAPTYNHERQGSDNAQVSMSWQEHPALRSVRGNLTLPDQDVDANTRVVEAISDKFVDLRNLSNMTHQSTLDQLHKSKAEELAPLTATVQQLRDSLNAATSALAQAEIKWDRDIQDNQSFHDELIKDMESDHLAVLEGFLAKPPHPSPVLDALAEAGVPLSVRDPRVWKQLTGFYNVSNDPIINNMSEYNEYFKPDICYDMEEAINNNNLKSLQLLEDYYVEINNQKHHIVSHTNDNNTGGGEVPIQGEAQTSGAGSGRLDSSNQGDLTPAIIPNNNNVALLPTGGTLTDTYVSERVKILISCAVRNNVYIMFVKNNLSNFVWVAGDTLSTDVDLRFTASRLTAAQAGLNVTSSEWQNLGKDTSLSVEGVQIMKTHITATALPQLKTQRDNVSIRAIWVPLAPALSLIRQPNTFSFEHVGNILYDHLSECHPVEWHSPLMGAAAISYLSPIIGTHIDLHAGTSATPGITPGLGRAQPLTISPDDPTRRLFRQTPAQDIGTEELRRESVSLAVTQAGNSSIKQVKTLIICKVTSELSPHVVLVQNNSGNWCIPQGPVHQNEQLVAVSTTKLVKDLTGLMVIGNQWKLLGYTHSTADESIAQYVAEFTLNSLPKLKSISDNHSVEARWIPIQAFIDLIKTKEILSNNDVSDVFKQHLEKTYSVEWSAAPDLLSAVKHLTTTGLDQGDRHTGGKTFVNNAHKMVRIPSWNIAKLSSLPKPKVWLQLVDDYMKVNNADYANHFHFLLEGDVLEWYYLLKSTRLSTNLPFDRDYIHTEFLARFTTTLLSESTQALQQLMNGDISLANCKNFHEYELSFNSCVREAGEVPVASKVMYFLRGLTPTLKAKCSLHPTTKKECASLEELIIHAKGTYTEMTMFPTGNGDPDINYFVGDGSNGPAKRPKHPFPKHPKQPLTDFDRGRTESGWAAALKRPKRGDGHGPGRGGRGTEHLPPRQHQGSGSGSGSGGGGGGNWQPAGGNRGGRYDRGRGRGRQGAGRQQQGPNVMAFSAQEPPDEIITRRAQVCSTLCTMNNDDCMWYNGGREPVIMDPCVVMRYRYEGWCAHCKQKGHCDKTGRGGRGCNNQPNYNRPTGKAFSFSDDCIKSIISLDPHLNKGHCWMFAKRIHEILY